MWVRGLKHIIKMLFFPIQVAPYVGAWIETPVFVTFRVVAEGRTLCGCVD